MKTRTSIAAVGVTATLTIGGALLAQPASATGATHTLKFIAVTTSNAQFGKSGGATFDRDVNAANKPVGYDIISFVGASDAGDVALATGHGFLYGRLAFGSAGAITGTVTGGTGAYAHATGTIAGQSISKKRSRVSITYRLHS